MSQGEANQDGAGRVFWKVRPRRQRATGEPLPKASCSEPVSSACPTWASPRLFNAVTRTRKAVAANYPFCTIDPNVGIVTVPDARLHELQRIAKTSVVIPAAIEFVDIAGLVKGASQGEGLGNKFLTHIREVDAIVQVVRCFEDADVHHVTGTVDPVRDIEIINTELMLADLESVRKRRERIAKEVKRGDKAAAGEDAVLAKIEDGARRGQAGADGRRSPPTSARSSQPFFLLTDKPTIFACNVREDEMAAADAQSVRGQGARLRRDAPGVRGGRHQRTDRERPRRPRARTRLPAFLARPRRRRERHRRAHPRDVSPARPADVLHGGREGSAGLDDPRRATRPRRRQASSTPTSSGASSRPRPWPTTTSSRCGSIAAARDQGSYRMEGKEYVVADGDVLLFKFNV